MGFVYLHIVLFVDHDFVAQEQELQTNTAVTRSIYQLTQEIHGIVTTQKAG